MEVHEQTNVRSSLNRSLMNKIVSKLLPVL